MSRVDVHPEELLDAARSGELSAADRERLDLHLAHCTACRVELEAMDDFARELAPRSDDAARAASIVKRALADAGWPDAGRLSRPSQAPRSSVIPTRRRTAAIAGAALAVGLFGGAAAAFWAATAGPWSDDPSDRTAGDADAQGSAGVDRALEGAREEAELDDTDDTGEAPAAPLRRGNEATTAEPSADATEGSPSDTDSDSLDRPRVDRTDRARTRPAVPAPTAEELLARANEERRATRNDEAERTYRTLQRLYPASREAAVSRVTLGRLLLSSRNDPAGALEQFDHYLRAQPAGVLAEEARVGRAMSLERLGRAEDARAAWRDLLAHHPDSLHADRARRAIE